MYLHNTERPRYLHIVFVVEKSIKRGRILRDTTKWVFIEAEGRLYKFRKDEAKHRCIVCNGREEAEGVLLYIEQYTRLQADFQPPWFCSKFTLQQLLKVRDLIGG